MPRLSRSHCFLFVTTMTMIAEMTAAMPNRRNVGYCGVDTSSTVKPKLLVDEVSGEEGGLGV